MVNLFISKGINWYWQKRKSNIEVDTTDLGETHYVFSKTQKLLNFGVKKVIWILPIQKNNDFKP